jgi:MFS family permease
LTNTPRPSAATAPRLSWVLGLTSIAYFMVVLHSVVVITALPVCSATFTGLASLQWTLTAYNIAFAAGIITAAALVDRIGRRRIFTTGLALFTAASAACALAPDAAELIAARTVQGLGGAIVLPLGLTILTAAFPAERRGVIVGVYGGLGGLADAVVHVVVGDVTGPYHGRHCPAPRESPATGPWGSAKNAKASPESGISVGGTTVLPPSFPALSKNAAASPASTSNVAPPWAPSWLAPIPSAIPFSPASTSP